MTHQILGIICGHLVFGLLLVNRHYTIILDTKYLGCFHMTTNKPQEQTTSNYIINVRKGVRKDHNRTA